MSKVVLIDSVQDPRWDKFVENHTFGCIYHTSMWLKIVRDSYGYRPLCAIIEDDKKNIESGMPLVIVNGKIAGGRLSTLPLAQHCNPLVKNQDVYDMLISYLSNFALKKNLKYIEIKTDS